MSTDAIYLKQMELGPMQNFVYLIGDPVARECVVVDPAWEIDAIVDTVARDEMVLTGALVTHTHQDHVGGSLEELCASERAMYLGRHGERPFLILCQQSEVDPTRAPEGRHTGYAYCHVPHGSSVDATDAIERQVERFAPGFRERILARHAMGPADFERYNPNFRGGAITGGVADALQLWNRPVTRLDPYSTPNPRIFICSSSTPPGGGVHGLCGYHAGRSALKRLN